MTLNVYKRVRMHVFASIRLSKVHLSFFVAFSSFFGSFINMSPPGDSAWYAAAAVFLLSCGCSTLNNIQDRDIDRLYQRTSSRPIPGHHVSLRFAVIQVLVLLGASFLMFYFCFETPVPLSAAILVVVLYNGCYTPLKRKTLFCLLPGALCGMMGPLIGWTASSPHQPTIQILIVMALFATWQLPHTWLVVLRHFHDYSGKQLPGFPDYFSRETLGRLLIVWVSALAVLMIYFAVQIETLWTMTRWLIVLNAWIMVAVLITGVFFIKKNRYKGLFVHLNLSLMVMQLVVVADRMIPI